jgi:hypothetical protein
MLIAFCTLTAVFLTMLLLVVLLLLLRCRVTTVAPYMAFSAAAGCCTVRLASWSI